MFGRQIYFLKISLSMVRTGALHPGVTLGNSRSGIISVQVVHFNIVLLFYQNASLVLILQNWKKKDIKTFLRCLRELTSRPATASSIGEPAGSHVYPHNGCMVTDPIKP